MDMKLTAEQEDFVRGARDWLRQAAPRYQVPSGQPIDDIESREAFERFQAWQGAKAEAGWAGLHWPCPSLAPVGPVVPSRAIVSLAQAVEPYVLVIQPAGRQRTDIRVHLLRSTH